MKPPSSIWPSSSTSYTGRRWRFSARSCEGLGAAGGLAVSPSPQSPWKPREGRAALSLPTYHDSFK